METKKQKKQIATIILEEFINAAKENHVSIDPKGLTVLLNILSRYADEFKQKDVYKEFLLIEPAEFLSWYNCLTSKEREEYETIRKTLYSSYIKENKCQK